MACKDDVDRKIIESIANYPVSKKLYYDSHKWFSCNLCMAGDDDYKKFNSVEELRSRLKSDDETLFKFILTYYFEQVGFDAPSKLSDGCTEGCKNYREKVKIKAHAVAMLQSFNNVLRTSKIQSGAEVWFTKFKNIFNKKSERFNERKLSKGCFESLFKFYELKKLDELRMNVENSSIKKAFDIVEEIKGVGDKVAKFVVRDLIFLLTDWGFRVKMEYKRENLEYAIPVDRWVQRVTLSIPLMKLKVFDLMQDDRLEKFISKAIVEVCSELEINPLMFDFGAYKIGESELETVWKSSKNNKFDRVYEQLKLKLLEKSG